MNKSASLIARILLVFLGLHFVFGSKVCEIAKLYSSMIIYLITLSPYFVLMYM
jgi:hypothetical protein